MDNLGLNVPLTMPLSATNKLGVERFGFLFSTMEKANVYNSIVIRNPSMCDCWSPKFAYCQRSLDEHIEFINQYQIEHATIIAEDIGFIKQCPTLKYIEVIPADSAKSFDYTPLYELKEIRYLCCRTAYGGCNEPYDTTIDYSKINGLNELNITGKGHLNFISLGNLKKLTVCQDGFSKNISQICNSHTLEYLRIAESRLISLHGIGKLHNLRDLSLYQCRLLNDISEMAEVRNSLRDLSIENCPKIKDFSCLYHLSNLEHLTLFGSNKLPNLQFLKKMKRLKVFIFSVEVADGDITPCLGLPYAAMEKGKKNYNLKNKDLPKSLP